MTLAEKKMNKEIREQLREQGILPPVKPRLNRKKFLQETWNEFDEKIITYADLKYLRTAIGAMVHRDENIRNVSSEQVGVLKVMKLAAAIKQFEQQKADAGEDSYNVGELYESVIKPITEL